MSLLRSILILSLHSKPPVLNTTPTQPSKNRQLRNLAFKSPSLQIYSSLLFDITPLSLSGQSTGSGQGSQPACPQLTGIIGVPPPPGSLAAALIAWSPAKGAVTGRKYHCQLSGVMAIQPCLWLIESQVCTALALRCIAHPWTGPCPAGSLRAPLTSLSFLTTGQPM